MSRIPIQRLPPCQKRRTKALLSLTRPRASGISFQDAVTVRRASRLRYMDPINAGHTPKYPVFATTHWSQVLQAGRPGSAEAEQALAALCSNYWYPLYTYVRRQGVSQPIAQDLTQEFFSKLLEKNYVGIADRKRGKFRWFLLTAFKCFLANEWDRARAVKRGGDAPHISLDALNAEERFQHEPVDSLTADQLFDRRWALDLLAQAKRRLRQEFEEAGKVDRLRCLEPFLTRAPESGEYAAAAAQLQVNEAAFRQEVHRFKKRFGQLLREEVAHTVIHPDDVADELQYLIDVVCRWGGLE